MLYLGIYLLRNIQLLCKAREEQNIILHGKISGTYELVDDVRVREKIDCEIGESKYLIYQIQDDTKTITLYGSVKCFIQDQNLIGEPVHIVCDQWGNPICCQEEIIYIKREMINKIIIILLLIFTLILNLIR